MGTQTAQVVFRQKSKTVWLAHLLNPRAARDATGRPVAWRPWAMVEERTDGRCTITFQGGSDPRGRRYSERATLDDAQRAVIRWAGRRFRVEAG